MKEHNNGKRMMTYMICGMIGCLFMAAGDWLMIYGDTTFEGNLAWMTNGVLSIAPWRNSLAMLTAFPAIIFYSVALFSIQKFFLQTRERKMYSMLTSLGLTPWLCLHLFYVMILYLFAWLHGNGYEAAAYEAGEALFAQFSWIVILAEVIMLLPFVYLIVVIAKGKTVFKKVMAWNNPLTYYIILKTLTYVMPDKPFRLAFTNGLMSEAMLIFFLVFLLNSKKLPDEK